MDWKVLRERLRTAREHARVKSGAAETVGMTLDQAAEDSGLNRATIHSIENVRREPRLKPGLETIERLASTYGLTLSSFFAQIEGQTDGDLQPSEIEDRTAHTPEGRIAHGREAAAVSLDPDKLLRAGNALVDAGGLFIAAAKGVEVKPRARARNTAGRGASGQRRRAGGNR